MRLFEQRGGAPKRENANRCYSRSRYNTLAQTIRERTNRYRVQRHRLKSTPIPSQEKFSKSLIRVLFGTNWIHEGLFLLADEVASTRKIPAGLNWQQSKEQEIKIQVNQGHSPCPSRRLYEHALYRSDQRNFQEIWVNAWELKS
jgi:hypothetical protein